MLRKTLYLANPYGFSDQSKQGPLAALVDALAAAGAKVWEPFARNNRTDRTRSGWAYRIGQADLGDVRAADGLFAVVNGCPPDEGVMVELGFAIAWGKPTFLFRDDYRRCAERGVSTELDAVRRPAGVRLGSVLVHLAWGDCRSRQGAPSLAEILTLPGVIGAQADSSRGVGGRLRRRSPTRPTPGRTCWSGAGGSWKTIWAESAGS